MVKSKIDVIVEETHEKYAEFDREQFIVDLDVGDRIEINVYDAEGKLDSTKSLTAKYSNCHINCQWQDKGEKQ